MADVLNAQDLTHGDERLEGENQKEEKDTLAD